MAEQRQPSESAEPLAGISPIPSGKTSSIRTTAPQRRGQLLLGVGLALLALIACCIVGSEFANFLYQRVLVPYSHFYDDDYAKLKEALAKRWGPDQSITAASMGIDMNDYGEMTGTWLVIELSYTGACTSTPADPCDQLADELARIVFDNYGKVNELTGICVIIGNKPFQLSVPPSEIMLKKGLTIEEWRKELSIGK